MGFFSRKRRCDWCGLRFSGAGIDTDDGLLLCGDDRLRAKEAPPLPASPGGGPAVFVPPLDDARAELGRAEAALRRYASLIMEAYESRDVGSVDVYLTEVETVSAEVWSQLNEARNTLRANGLDVSVFDQVRERGVPDVSDYGNYRVSRSVGLDLSLKKTTTVDVNPDGLVLAEAAFGILSDLLSAH